MKPATRSAFAPVEQVLFILLIVGPMVLVSAAWDLIRAIGHRWVYPLAVVLSILASAVLPQPWFGG
jgi:hypothetical protein